MKNIFCVCRIKTKLAVQKQTKIRSREIAYKKALLDGRITKEIIPLLLTEILDTKSKLNTQIHTHYSPLHSGLSRLVRDYI